MESKFSGTIVILMMEGKEVSLAFSSRAEMRASLIAIDDALATGKPFSVFKDKDKEPLSVTVFLAKAILCVHAVVHDAG